jgi:hypothetical protein
LAAVKRGRWALVPSTASGCEDFCPAAVAKYLKKQHNTAMPAPPVATLACGIWVAATERRAAA